MLLKVKAYPFKGTIEKTLKQQGDSYPGAQIMLKFNDEDGFEIFTQKIRLANMKSFGEYLEADEKIKMTIEKYNVVARGNYNFGRAGFIE